MAKKPENQTKNEQVDALADDIMAVVNKKFKDTPNAMVSMVNANLVTHWVSTGSSVLDLAISNIPNGGLGYGTIVEILGPSQSSKSLIAATVLANTQKQGGLAVLFDTENAVGMLEFYKSFGLDVTKVKYSDKIRALEDVFAAMEIIILKHAEAKSEVPITIVVDSVMGATTVAELEADYQRPGWNTGKATILGLAMRKITSLLVGRKILLVFINQIRSKLGVTFGEQTTTAGGKAIEFHSSVRLKTKTKQKLYYPNTKDEYGNTVEVTVIKNRLAMPGRVVKFDIAYSSGIDDVSSWLETAKNLGIINQSAAWYSYDMLDEETGELTTRKFQSKEFKKLLSEPGMRDRIYGEICAAYIKKYNTGDEFDVDTIVREDFTQEDE